VYVVVIVVVVVVVAESKEVERWKSGGDVVEEGG
jgi:hypothetical protein